MAILKAVNGANVMRCQTSVVLNQSIEKSSVKVITIIYSNM